jgi:hypothetical protein
LLLAGLVNQSVVYRAKQLVIEPANHAKALTAFVKEHCTAMVLRATSPMPQGGLRKRGTFGAWLSESANKEFEGSEKPSQGHAKVHQKLLDVLIDKC